MGGFASAVRHVRTQALRFAQDALECAKLSVAALL